MIEEPPIQKPKLTPEDAKYEFSRKSRKIFTLTPYECLILANYPNASKFVRKAIREHHKQRVEEAQHE